MAIWSMQTDVDFTEFKFPVSKDRDFFHQLAASYFDESKKACGEWTTIYLLRDEPKKNPDFFEIDESDVFAISEKAVSKLSPIFPNDIELLPIKTDAGKYYALNVVNFIDCLDHSRSKYQATQDGKIVTYSKLKFNESQLNGCGIFKIPQLPYEILISDAFEEICLIESLDGLSFDPNQNLMK